MPAQKMSSGPSCGAASAAARSSRFRTPPAKSSAPTLMSRIANSIRIPQGGYGRVGRPGRMFLRAILPFLASAYLAASLVVYSGYVNTNVPNPYMDELFHFPQATHYCNGEFSEWDPKLTTPPGLYFASLVLEHAMASAMNLSALAYGLVRSTFGFSTTNQGVNSSRSATSDMGSNYRIACSLTSLRAINVIFGLATFAIIFAILVSINRKRRRLRQFIAHREAIESEINTGNGRVRKTNSEEGEIQMNIGVMGARRSAGTIVMSPSEIAIQSLTLTMLPFLFFFYFLYYTDPGSTFFVLSSYLLSFRKEYTVSAMLALVSLTFRQTNAVWVCYIAASSLLREIVAYNIRKERKRLQSLPSGSADDSGVTDVERESNTSATTRGSARQRKPSTSNPKSKAKKSTTTITDEVNLQPPAKNRNLFSSHILTPTDVLSWAMKNQVVTVQILLPYLLVVLAFGYFILANGGIALGDKSNHQASIHVPQFYYFLITLCGFLFPTIDLVGSYRLLRSKVKRNKLIYFLLFGNLCLFVALSIQKFTIVHPFMISDNRHYVFYLWKRVYGRHWSIPLLFSPVYLIVFYLLSRKLATSSIMCALEQIGFWLCTFVVLSTSPLFEFRYYIIPFLIYAVNITFRVSENATPGSKVTKSPTTVSASASAPKTKSKTKTKSRSRSRSSSPQKLAQQTETPDHDTPVPKPTDSPHLSLPSIFNIVAPLLMVSFVNFITIYVFTKHPFYDDSWSRDGVSSPWQRYMW